MPKNMDSPVEWVAIALIILLLLVGAIAAANAQQSLADSNDKARVYLEQVAALAALTGGGVFRVTILRQSGNIYAEHEATDAAAALQKALSTFRRANIEAVNITINTPTQLHFNRLFYSHRGSNEGKKVGSVQIDRLS